MNLPTYLQQQPQGGICWGVIIVLTMLVLTVRVNIENIIIFMNRIGSGQF